MDTQQASNRFHYNSIETQRLIASLLRKPTPERRYVALHILGEIMHRQRSSDVVKISVASYSRDLGISRTTINAAVADLVNSGGLVKEVSSKGLPCSYSIGGALGRTRIYFTHVAVQWAAADALSLTSRADLATALHVIGMVAAHAKGHGSDGDPWRPINVTALAVDLGIDRKDLSRLLRLLVEAGLLRVSGAAHRVRSYAVGPAINREATRADSEADWEAYTAMEERIKRAERQIYLGTAALVWPGQAAKRDRAEAAAEGSVPPDGQVSGLEWGPRWSGSGGPDGHHLERELLEEGEEATKKELTENHSTVSQGWDEASKQDDAWLPGLSLHQQRAGAIDALHTSLLRQEGDGVRVIYLDEGKNVPALLKADSVGTLSIWTDDFNRVEVDRESYSTLYRCWIEDDVTSIGTLLDQQMESVGGG